MSIQQKLHLTPQQLKKLNDEEFRIVVGIPVIQIINGEFQMVIFRKPNRYDGSKMPIELEEQMQKQFNKLANKIIDVFENGIDVDL